MTKRQIQLSALRKGLSRLYNSADKLSREGLGPADLAFEEVAQKLLEAFDLTLILDDDGFVPGQFDAERWTSDKAKYYRVAKSITLSALDKGLTDRTELEVSA